MVVTLRRGTTGSEGAELAAVLARHEGVRVDLVGLPEDDAAALVSQVGGDVDVDDLWTRSSGNPFFLIELARSVGTVSGSLTDVVLSRVRRLPSETQRLLEAAAVVDLVFGVDLASFMTGHEPEEGLRLIEPAVAAGLVVDNGLGDGVYRFAHGVVREVVHDSLGDGTRIGLHRAVSTVLAERSMLRRVDQRAALVHHWEATGTTYANEAWRSILARCRGGTRPRGVRGGGRTPRGGARHPAGRPGLGPARALRPADAAR